MAQSSSVAVSKITSYGVENTRVANEGRQDTMAYKGKHTGTLQMVRKDQKALMILLT